MAELYIHKQSAETVFELLGDSENDITKSIAWGFVKCPVLLEMVIKRLLGIDVDARKISIQYQVYEKDKGITDLELTDNENFYLIIEAKRGWNLPKEDQLSMYASKENFKNDRIKHKAIASMSECTEEYAKDHLPKISAPLIHLSWKTICELAEKAEHKSNNAQKNLLRELVRYIKRIMSTQNKDTNWVYVVSLGSGKIEIEGVNGKSHSSELTWIDIVEMKGMYFCTVGGGKGGWPKEPLNYIAFRYRGKLQSIHHIESYKIVDELHEAIPEIPHFITKEKLFLYKLGPAIRPLSEVNNGDRIVRNNRVWVQIDTLLTSKTITEAWEISQQRKE